MADHAAIRELASRLVAELTAAGKTVATAESCTGGWIAKAITDIPGSSAVFAYGIVTYSNDAKVSMLGVQTKTIEDHGAVSELTVKEMVTGAANMSSADIAMAVSGVAGPDGGTADKPVGTVWFAWAVKGAAATLLETDRQRFAGDRERVRELSVRHAIQGVLERLQI
jgi:nicotinamide-nucleotide amidase